MRPRSTETTESLMRQAREAFKIARDAGLKKRHAKRLAYQNRPKENPS